MAYEDYSSLINNPVKSNSANPAVASYYNSNWSKLSANEALAGMAGQAKQADIAGSAAQSLAEKKKSNKLTGTGFRRTISSSGGYNFWDDEGQPITAWDFARAKGVGLSDALQESGDPGDMKVIQDYGEIKDIMNAAFSGTRIV